MGALPFHPRGTSWESIFICSVAVRLGAALHKDFLSTFKCNKPQPTVAYHVEMFPPLPSMAACATICCSLAQGQAEAELGVLLSSPQGRANTGADANSSRQNGTIMRILLATAAALAYRRLQLAPLTNSSVTVLRVRSAWWVKAWELTSHAAQM